MKNKNSIKIGNVVRIKIPRIVTRVGYPKQVSDYLEQARQKYGPSLERDIGWSFFEEKALHQIAYGMARNDGFGGKERSLHFLDVPELEGREMWVSGFKMCCTGTYYPPQQGGEDFEPGGLRDMQHHKLVRLSGLCFDDKHGLGLFPLNHLEKVDV